MKYVLISLFALLSFSLYSRHSREIIPDFTIYKHNSVKNGVFFSSLSKNPRVRQSMFSPEIKLFNTSSGDESQSGGGEEGSEEGDSFANDEEELAEDATGDAAKKKKKLSREELREKIRNNPITKDLDFSWFREKYRLEKLFIAIGIVSLTMGVPFILSGVLCYVIQPTDRTDLGDSLYFSLIGIGGGLMVTGSSFLIVGAVRLFVMKKNNRIQVRLTPSGNLRL